MSLERRDIVPVRTMSLWLLLVAGDRWLRLRRANVEIDFSLCGIDYTHPDFVRYGRIA